MCATAKRKGKLYQCFSVLCPLTCKIYPGSRDPEFFRYLKATVAVTLRQGLSYCMAVSVFLVTLKKCNRSILKVFCNELILDMLQIPVVPSKIQNW